MSNSSLATITQISPNKNSPRVGKIDTITIHHTAGVCSAQTIADIFAPTSRQASCNYGIGNDGHIALIVDECDRSWCSSSSSNDHRAITIEVSNDAIGDRTSGKGWTIGEKAYNSLIDLCVDICKRNGIKELKWKNDSSLIGKPEQQNMTVHKWFSSTACPGDYLLGKMGDIASEVNARLVDDILYRVQVGAFSNKDNAYSFLEQIRSAGFDGFVVMGKK